MSKLRGKQNRGCSAFDRLLNRHCQKGLARSRSIAAAAAAANDNPTSGGASTKKFFKSRVSANVASEPSLVTTAKKVAPGPTAFRIRVAEPATCEPRVDVVSNETSVAVGIDDNEEPVQTKLPRLTLRVKTATIVAERETIAAKTSDEDLSSPSETVESGETENLEQSRLSPDVSEHDSPNRPSSPQPEPDDVDGPTAVPDTCDIKSIDHSTCPTFQATNYASSIEDEESREERHSVTPPQTDNCPTTLLNVDLQPAECGLSDVVDDDKESECHPLSVDHTDSDGKPVDVEHQVNHVTNNHAAAKRRPIFAARDKKTKLKGRARYKHGFWNQKPDSGVDPNLTKNQSSLSHLDFDCDAGQELNEDLLKQSSTVNAANQVAEFSVVRQVKEAHQIQDSGEFQEFNDDVEYILDGLRSSNQPSTRSLSTLTLATKCMTPTFRMHLRAHGVLSSMMKELADAPEFNGLALCTSAVFYVLSQDRLNMDLDRDSLQLLLNLLDIEKDDHIQSDDFAELSRHKEKVKELIKTLTGRSVQVEEIAKSGGKYGNPGPCDMDMKIFVIDSTWVRGISNGEENIMHRHTSWKGVDIISANQLAMDTLLSLTSKRAGEWFKEALRQLGGIDHLVRTFVDCIDVIEFSVTDLEDNSHLDKANRVLKVLENVTYENCENCQYLMRFDSALFVVRLHDLLQTMTTSLLQMKSVSLAGRDLLFNTVRVFINLAHRSPQSVSDDSLTVDSVLHNSKKLITLALDVLLVLTKCEALVKVGHTEFDLQILTLTLLINLTEHDEANRLTVVNKEDNATEKLVHLLLDSVNRAADEESKTDAILDGVSESKQSVERKNHADNSVNTIDRLLDKAGSHMEKTLVAAYTALMIGYLISADDREQQIRHLLPEQNFSVLTNILAKFLNFMRLTASSSLMNLKSLQATENMINRLKKMDESSNEEDGGDKTADESLLPPPFDLDYSTDCAADQSSIL